MKTIIERKEFFPRNATVEHTVYTIEKYSVKNGFWYRVCDLVPSIPYFSWKSFRSEKQARENYDAKVKLEQWRNDKE